MNQLSLTRPTLIEQMTKRLSSAENQAIIEKTNRFLERELFLEEIEIFKLELNKCMSKDWLYVQIYQMKGTEKLSFSFKGKKYEYSLGNIEQAYPQFLQDKEEVLRQFHDSLNEWKNMQEHFQLLYTKWGWRIHQLFDKASFIRGMFTHDMDLAFVNVTADGLYYEMDVRVTYTDAQQQQHYFRSGKRLVIKQCFTPDSFCVGCTGAETSGTDDFYDDEYLNEPLPTFSLSSPDIEQKVEEFVYARVQHWIDFVQKHEKRNVTT